MKLSKLLLPILLFFIVERGFPQDRLRYFVIDSTIQKGLKFNHLKCADNRYQVELFNVFDLKNKELLTLFTALPDHKTRKPEWKEIKLDSISNKIVSIDTLTKQFEKNLSAFINSRGEKAGWGFKDNFIKPIIRLGNKFYTPISQTLMEHFILTPHQDDKLNLTDIFPNLNQFFEININAPIFPLAKFEQIYMKQLKHPSFNSAYDTFDRFNTHYLYNSNILIRDNDTQIMGKKAYKFWTLGSWTIDGDNSQRGIDRFTYIPGIGIISGAYSYFYWYENGGKIRTLPASELVDRYLKDIQLMPYEINGNKIPVK